MFVAIFAVESTGPRTDEGRQRIAAVHFRQGGCSKSHLQQRRIEGRARAFEADLIQTGLLKKDWRQLFNYWGGGPLNGSPPSKL